MHQGRERRDHLEDPPAPAGRSAVNRQKSDELSSGTKLDETSFFRRDCRKQSRESVKRGARGWWRLTLSFWLERPALSSKCTCSYRNGMTSSCTKCEHKERESQPAIRSSAQGSRAHPPLRRHQTHSHRRRRRRRLESSRGSFIFPSNTGSPQPLLRRRASEPPGGALTRTWSLGEVDWARGARGDGRRRDEVEFGPTAR